MKALELQKQFLIAESELNRAQLAEEWGMMRREIAERAHLARTVAAWASSAALLWTGVRTLRRAFAGAGSGKPSWFEKILEAARVASTLWSAFRAREDKEGKK